MKLNNHILTHDGVQTLTIVFSFLSQGSADAKRNGKKEKDDDDEEEEEKKEEEDEEEEKKTKKVSRLSFVTDADVP